MVDLHVVVARVDHPEPGQAHFLVDLLFDDRVGPVVVGADDFRGEPELAGRGRDQGTGPGRRVVSGDRRTCGAAGSSRVLARLATLAWTTWCSRGRCARAAARGRGEAADSPLSVSAYGWLMYSARTLRRNRPVCERLLRGDLLRACLRPPPGRRRRRLPGRGRSPSPLRRSGRGCAR